MSEPGATPDGAIPLGDVATSAPLRRPDFYPQRPAESETGALDRFADRIFRRLWHRLRAQPRRAFARRVIHLGQNLTQLDDAELALAVRAQALRLRRGNTGSRDLARVYALIREVSSRTLGLRHYPSQIMAARAMSLGAIAEMQTGEGKTLTATLTAGAAALAGMRVHLVTANDYLAARDAEAMAPVYQGLGLTVAAVVEGMEPEARKAAHAADVVYCAGKEIAFDHLRDRCAMGRRNGTLRLRMRSFIQGAKDPRATQDGGLLLPGLQFAIVDEADSVMIDEARTPLILSGTPPGAEAEAAAILLAVDIAGTLRDGETFLLDMAARNLRLTQGGRAAIAERAEDFPADWRARPMRESLVETALSALHLHHRGEHYLVRDDKVVIVDENTGRVQPDRSWSAGLHQAVEAKEGVSLTDRRETFAQITYQRFFRRYRHLCGMTGTATEAASELWSVYRLPVVRIATHRRPQRRDMGTRILPTAARKWALVAQQTARLVAAGRPVLIGCRTVAAAEKISALLTEQRIVHQVLSAHQDADEAEIIARAGAAGRVTVATNMAGRGTDILLGPGVAEAGGLHVILTERHTSRRIDRQLVGRCGRQGDPGSAQAILSLDDALLDQLRGTIQGRIKHHLARLPGMKRAALFDVAQNMAERRHRRARAQLLAHDDRLADNLAFTGSPE